MDLSTIQVTALSAAANGILIINRNGQIEWSNPAATQLTGYSAAELLGQNPRMLKSGVHSDDYYRKLWDTILAGRVWQGETVNRRKDGSLYTELQTITPVRDERGEITHFIAIKQDISSEKQAQSELEEKNRELLAASQAEQREHKLAESLFQAALAADSSLDLQEVLDRILEQVATAIPCRAALLMILEQGHVRVVRQRGLEHIGELRPILSASHTIQTFRPIRKVAQSMKTLVVSDSYADPERQDVPGLEWVQSYACAPLAFQNEFAGVVLLFSEQVRYFDQSVVVPLEAFAAHASLALEHARLFDKEQSARRTAEILQAASVLLAQSLDLDTVLNNLLDSLDRLVDYDCAMVYLAEKPMEFKLSAKRGEPGGAVLSSKINLDPEFRSKPPWRQLFEEKIGILFDDTLDAGTAEEAETARVNSQSVQLYHCMGIPLISGLTFIGWCKICRKSPERYTTEHLRPAETLAGQAAVAVQNAWLFEQVRSGRERLVSLSHRLVEVQENERRYIARELHDQAGQALISLKVGLSLLEKKVDDPQAVLAIIADLKSQAEAVLDDLHRLAIDLRPVSLDQVGLVEAIRQQINNLKSQGGIEVSFTVLGTYKQLPADIENNLYRIVQEALTNVVRHARANRIQVLLDRRDKCLVIMVEDDGIGFESDLQKNDGHLGLFGMQERAEILGGRLSIDSNPGSGTSIYVEVPL